MINSVARKRAVLHYWKKKEICYIAAIHLTHLITMRK